MVLTSELGEDLVATPLRVNPTHRFLKVFFGRKVVIFGTVILGVLGLVAILAPVIAPYDPYKTYFEISLSQPSAEHWLGTDRLGRDVLSRIIFGSRTSLMVGSIAIGIGAITGTFLGLIAGYLGGMISPIIMRTMDALLAIPMLLLALAITAVMGGGLIQMMIALGIATIPSHARLMHGMVLSVKQSDYVLAGVVMGGSNLRIMLRHVFPNCSANNDNLHLPSRPTLPLVVICQGQGS
ncbi:ABC transporter permease [Thermodesulfobacteriota bacterium]